jgi:type I restriction enzyme, R subunit
MSMVGVGLIKTESLLNEADTCRKYVEPGLVQAGWDDEPHSFTGQQSFTDGRIFVVGDKPKRKSHKRADYLLRYTRDFKIAVVEAKAKYKNPGDGLQHSSASRH